MKQNHDRRVFYINIIYQLTFFVNEFARLANHQVFVPNYRTDHEL